MKKERLDVLMVQRNLAESREKAKALIMSGIVYVNGQKEDKAGTSFEETVQIEVRGSTLKYVSRGGLKLEKAMNRFGVVFHHIFYGLYTQNPKSGFHSPVRFQTLVHGNLWFRKRDIPVSDAPGNRISPLQTGMTS